MKKANAHLVPALLLVTGLIAGCGVASAPPDTRQPPKEKDIKWHGKDSGFDEVAAGRKSAKANKRD